MKQEEVEYRSLPAGPNGGWRVQIRFGVDHIQYIYGFDTEFEANEWIEREANNWMKSLDAEL